MESYIPRETEMLANEISAVAAVVHNCQKQMTLLPSVSTTSHWPVEETSGCFLMLYIFTREQKQVQVLPGPLLSPFPETRGLIGP